MSMQSSFQPDSIVQAIVDKFILRAQMGKEKYGTDMDRNDLNTNQWIEHAQDELMDGIIYLQKLKQDFPSPPIGG